MLLNIGTILSFGFVLVLLNRNQLENCLNKFKKNGKVWITF